MRGNRLVHIGVVLTLVLIAFGILSNGLSSSKTFAAAPRQQHVTAGTLGDTQTYTTYLPVVSQNWSGILPPFGVQYYGIPSPNKGLTYAMEAGVRWIRVPLSWRAIEPANTIPAYYNWTYLDAQVSSVAAGADSTELIITISEQPEWAALYPSGPVTNTEDLLEFVGAVVGRYNGSDPDLPEIRFFELYNEPDNTDPDRAAHAGWGFWGNNGAGYAVLLKQLYPVMKAANPNAQLVFGGIALDWFVDDDPPGIFDECFLRDVLQACQGHLCFDVMNFHYYPVFYERWLPYGPGIVGKTNYVREQLRQYGFGDVPVIVTEAGWDSASSWGSTELQDRYPAILYSRGMSVNLDVVIWFMIRDLEHFGAHGLLDIDYQPKSSYWAYRVMTSMLSFTSYQRPLSLAETGSGQIEGYVFVRGTKRIDVVWVNDVKPLDPSTDAPSLPLVMSAQRLRVTDKYGVTYLVSDIDDGVLDGGVEISVDGSPLYLEYNP